MLSKNMIRPSFIGTCSPSRACDRKTMVHSSRVGSLSLKSCGVISMMVELNVEGFVDRVDRIVWSMPSLVTILVRFFFRNA